MGIARTFKLYNYDRSSSFNLASDSIMVTDVEGLGTNVNTSYDASRFKRYVTEMHFEFDDIGLTIAFGIKNNAYVDYNDLMIFINANGNRDLILEYNVRTGANTIDIKYCNIRLKNAPKTQRDSTNTMILKFAFTRLSPWWIPRTIPQSSTYVITNNFFEHIPLYLQVYGAVATFAKVKLATVTAKYEPDQVVKINANIKANGYFILDAELKKAELKNPGEVHGNSYDMIDHTGESFIMIPPGGTSRLTVEGASGETPTFTGEYKEVVY